MKASPSYYHSLSTVASRVRRRTNLPLPQTVFVLCRLYSATPDSGLKSTLPSSSRPPTLSATARKADEGYLSFTNSSLYKLTLPLTSSSDGATCPSRIKPDSAELHSVNESNSSKGTQNTWEQRIEKGEHPFTRQDNDHEKQDEVTCSVIFLLHPGQPLSYIANLVREEGPDAESKEKREDGEQESGARRKKDPLGDPPITFHTSLRSKRRWSPSTGIGDFLREAARIGSFTITIGLRNIRVNVPAFEERTRFLRAALHEKTRRIETLAHVKDECDLIARRATQRYAFGGAGVMSCWWLTVGLLTFKTDLGWDVMEPITYLTGFGMAIGGYFWFLWHNREVSYRSVLTESTSRRQQKLYAERGFDVDEYQELIGEVKGLRRAIKRISWDYGLEWDQGDTEAGRSVHRALEIVRREEELDQRRKQREEKEEKEDDEALAHVDDDGDGHPDRKS